MTRLIKVKAHIGITGNELADAAAERARTRQNTAGDTDTADAEDEPLCLVDLVHTSTRKSCTKADITDICEDAHVAKIKAEHAANKRANTNAKPSTAMRWIENIEAGNLLPDTYPPFDKTRLYHLHAKAVARARTLQRPRLMNQPCPLCRKPVKNIFHARGACTNATQAGLITDAADAAVHKIAAACGEGAYKDDVILVNAGTKYSQNGTQDHTVPYWMLPEAKWGKIGHRRFPDEQNVKFADAVDMMLVKGWKKGTNPPTDKSNITLVPVEHSSTHDLYTRERRNAKRSKYYLLVEALRREGWNVELHETTEQFRAWFVPDGQSSIYRDEGMIDDDTRPIHVIVMGHAGSHCPASRHALMALGITSTNDAMRALSKLAAKHLYICCSTYNRSAKSNARAVAIASAAPVGVG
jgi:hypothetical protein